MNPVASVIIRCRDEERFIGQALEAVFGQEACPPFEVIVIDSGSKDSTLDIVRGFDVRLYEIPPGGFTFGSALNYGAGLAEGEYLVNLSAHCIPVDANWMANLLSPLMEDASIVATYGKQEPIIGLNPFEEMTLINDFAPDANGDILPVFSNSNCAIRKETWSKYKFDEETAHAEDFIWAKRLPPQCKIKYAPDASVYHSHPLTFRYWKSRHHNGGLFVWYLENIYGIEWPWAPSDKKESVGILRGLLLSYRSFLTTLRHVNGFLIGHGYYRYALISPAVIYLQGYYYRKGLKDAERRYEHIQKR